VEDELVGGGCAKKKRFQKVKKKSLSYPAKPYHKIKKANARTARKALSRHDQKGNIVGGEKTQKKTNEEKRENIRKECPGIKGASEGKQKKIRNPYPRRRERRIRGGVLKKLDTRWEVANKKKRWGY